MAAFLSNRSREERCFDPPGELAANANVTSDAYAQADQDRLGFWAEQARRLSWDSRWDQVLDWSSAPVAKPGSTA